MAKTNKGLVAYANAQLGHPYWYGTFGQVSTKALYDAKKRQYPNQYTWACPSNQLNTRVYDCIGLVKGYLWSDTATSTPKYNAKQDVGANSMNNLCKEKGPISTIPELPGVLVFLPGHVGVYIGNGEVIEARGHAYGVVKTKLKDRPWKTWGKCPWIIYETPTATPPTPTKKKTLDEIAKEVIAGKWGNGEDRKKRLKVAGYDPTAVQKKVNELLKANTSSKKSNTEIAKEVIAGKWGNGTERKKRLTAAGYDYTAIQKEVNRLLK